MIALQILSLPFGEMLAGVSGSGICLLEYFENGRTEMQLPRLERVFGERTANAPNSLFDALEVELSEYFTGKRKVFDLPLDIRGTTFQVNSWNALLEIPYGQTRSYAEQAERIGNKKSVRAVANANRNNRISIIVPCHRVIGKNGTMTGYGGGIERKEFLLELEGAKTSTRPTKQMSLALSQK